MKKSTRNIIISASAAAIIGGAAGGLVLYDSNFDHTESICPFTKVLGVEHQIEKISEKEKYYDVFTNSTMSYTVPYIVAETKLVPYCSYEGYDYIPEYGTIAPNYVTEYKEVITTVEKNKQYNITAAEDEIVFVDPNEAIVVKTLKLK